MARVARRTADATNLRGLAHPLRVRILGLLRMEGAATASGLAARLGESSGTTSWHLRQLAEYGFVVEDAGRGNRRERWWRAAEGATQLNAADFVGEQGLEGSLSTFLYAVAEENFARVTEFVNQFLSGQWERPWHRAITISDDELPLTAAELSTLNGELQALVDRYRRAPKPGDTPVVVQVQSFPRKREPGEGGS
ncbi:MAG: ArsR/SmtB family transcription factor [Sciscionella sp.]